MRENEVKSGKMTWGGVEGAGLKTRHVFAIIPIVTSKL